MQLLLREIFMINRFHRERRSRCLMISSPGSRKQSLRSRSLLFQETTTLPERLDYASRLLGSHHIYIAGKVPETEDEHLRKITLQDEYGNVHFWLLPFLKPGYVRGLCGGELPESYTDAVRTVLEREQIDPAERNVLVSHQFYTGKDTGTGETVTPEDMRFGGAECGRY